MSDGPTLRNGMNVRVKDSLLPRLLVTVRKQVEGRTGIVTNVYRPLGSNRWRATVQFIRKGSRKVLPTGHMFYPEDLEIVESTQ